MIRLSPSLLLALLSFPRVAAAADPDPPARWRLPTGHPRTLFFRSERELAALPPEEAVRRLSDFDAVSIKLFREAARQDLRKLIPTLAALKQQHPERPVLLHLDHFAAVRPLEGSRLSPGREYPPYDPDNVFPGHWLYYPGSTLTSAVGGADLTLAVHDAVRFHPGDDVRLVRPAWSSDPACWRRSEVTFVREVDARANTLHVERGKYATAAQPFPADSLVIPHAKLRYGNPAWYWTYNFSTTVPRDELGRTAGQWFADWIADEIRAVNARYGYRVLDGVEFDVTKFNLTFGQQPLEGTTGETGPSRGQDCDLDGVADRGYDRGWPAFGLGTIETMQRLRERLGPDYLLLGDSLWTLWRPWPYANGMDNESFPDIRKPWRWSGAFDRLLSWAEHAQEPRLSMIFTRAGEDRLPGQVNAFQTVRHAMSAALQAGAWHCVSGLPAGDPHLPDEYVGGRLGQRHWLGAPLEPAVRLPQLRGPNLAPYGDFEDDKALSAVCVKAKDDYQVLGPLADTDRPATGARSLRLEVRQLPRPPAAPNGLDARLELPFEAQPNHPYTLQFRARAAHRYAQVSPSCTGIPWGLTVSLFSGKGGRQNTGQHALLIPDAWRQFCVTLVARPATAPAAFVFELGAEPGTLWLDDVQIHEGEADVFYRRFEHGLVLTSGVRTPVAVDLSQVEQRRTLRRLSATQVDGRWQSDPTVNDGRLVDKHTPVTLKPFDGLFLHATETS